MTDDTEDPVGHAGSKIVQYVSLATMAAEAIAEVRQQRAATAAGNDQRTAGALRAAHASALAAARLQWRPALDAGPGGHLDLAATGLAWAASQAWREVDPEAQLACDRALARFRELRPEVMDRFDRLTADGLDPVEAMRRVAPFFDRPPARPGRHVARPALTHDPAGTGAGAPDRDRPTGTDPPARAAGDHSPAAHVVDQQRPATPLI